MTLQTETTTRAAGDAERAARDAAMRRWERLRANGRSAFVWRNGVVGWGLPAALVTAAYKIIQNQGLVWPTTLDGELRTPLILIALVFPALGYLFGGWLWTQGEAQYRRLREDADEARRTGHG